MQEKKLQKAKKKLKKLKLQLANPSLGKVDVKPHLGLKRVPTYLILFSSIFLVHSKLDCQRGCIWIEVSTQPQIKVLCTLLFPKTPLYKIGTIHWNKEKYSMETLKKKEIPEI